MKRIMKTIILSLMISLSSEMLVFADTTNNENLKKQIYNHMKNWDTSFNFTYNQKSALKLLEEASEMDDYLERSISLYKTARIDDRFSVKIEYRTTKEQEKLIDLELKRVLDKIINKNMTTVEKIEVVNEYIVKIYKYDHSLKSDNVYSAMKSGETICQGYAMTAYKMFKMLGIDCRIVNGYKDGTTHAWNLVKIDNNWYHLDITNNDSIIRNKYLLKSDEFMKKNGFVWDVDKYTPAVKNYYDFRTEYIDYYNDKESHVERYYDSSLFTK